jgi:hypothetical protein
MKKFLILIVFASAILLPTDLLAWGTTGHRVVAQIAQDNIKSSTKKKINKLLDNLPMAYWANWPDFIKSDKTGEWDRTFIWHYVNAPRDLSKEAFVDYIKNVSQENLYSEIPKLERIIQDKVSSIEQKRIALIFLIHLIGDAHQPMHVGCEDDLGGNKITLYWFNERSNLHSVWDGKLIDFEKYSYTEYSNILNILPKDNKKQFKSGTLEDWLYESHCLANEIYSSVNNEDKVSFDYSYKYKSVVELQLQKAGLRLASVLDTIFQ